MVDDVTSPTLRQEKVKQNAARLSNKQRHNHCKRYRIVMQRKDYLFLIEDQGFTVAFNPEGNGNCQFSALCHQLHEFGIFRTPGTMRDEVVRYLQENPVDQDGFPLLELVPQFNSFEDYLANMSTGGVFEDQITLYAAAQFYGVNVNIVSSLGTSGAYSFNSQDDALGDIFLKDSREPW